MLNPYSDLSYTAQTTIDAVHHYNPRDLAARVVDIFMRWVVGVPVLDL